MAEENINPDPNDPVVQILANTFYNNLLVVKNDEGKVTSLKILGNMVGYTDHNFEICFDKAKCGTVIAYACKENSWEHIIGVGLNSLVHKAKLDQFDDMQACESADDEDNLMLCEKTVDEPPISPSD